MKLTVNGEQRELPDGASIDALLEAMGLAGQPVAVEVNRQVVPKRQHPNHTLADGDTIEMVTLVGGG
jgi:sulfur carrier protein